jgi:hypothetical protein
MCNYDGNIASDKASAQGAGLAERNPEMSAKTQASKAAQKAKWEAKKAAGAFNIAWQGPRLPIIKAVVETIEEIEEVMELAAPASKYDIAGSLRTAAYRAESIGQTPASEKQISYLASLMQKAGHDAMEFEMNTATILTTAGASKRIEAYLNR